MLKRYIKRLEEAHNSDMYIAEENKNIALQELRDKAVEAFTDFVTNYCHEAGYSDIYNGKEHYIEYFTKKITY